MYRLPAMYQILIHYIITIINIDYVSAMCKALDMHCLIFPFDNMRHEL